MPAGDVAFLPTSHPNTLSMVYCDLAVVWPSDVQQQLALLSAAQRLGYGRIARSVLVTSAEIGI